MTVRYRFRERGGHEPLVAHQGRPRCSTRDGDVRLAINVIEDITELKRAEQASGSWPRRAACSPARSTTRQTLRDGRPPGGARDRRLVRGRPRGAATSIERVAVAHVDPAKVELARELPERYPADPRPPPASTSVLRTGAAELYAGDHRRDARRGGARRGAPASCSARSGMRSAMLVPMRLRDRVLGAISFVSPSRAGGSTRSDLALAEDLALRAARGGRERAPVRDALDDRARRCRSRCCRRCCRRSRRSSSPPLYRAGRRGPRGRRRLLRRLRHRPRTSGSRSSATSAARAPRRRR